MLSDTLIKWTAEETKYNRNALCEMATSKVMIFMRVERLHVQRIRRGTRGVVLLVHVSRYHVQQTAVIHWSYKFIKL